MKSRLRAIRLLLMDVDGVLTDGRLYHLVDKRGRLIELKGVDTQDGIALAWLAKSGIRTGVISGRSSDGLEARARMLKMSFIIQGTVEKVPAFERILRQARLDPSQVAFIGDDLPDLPLIRRAGLGVAVANARPEVKSAARYVTRSVGGSGAVREVAEMLLKAQGFWDGIKRHYCNVPRDGVKSDDAHVRPVRPRQGYPQRAGKRRFPLRRGSPNRT